MARSRPSEARPGGGHLLQPGDIELALGIVGDDAVRHALFADAGGQSAGIDAGEADNIAGFQPLVEMPGRAVVGGLGHRFLDDAADDAGRGREVRRLDIVVIGADIADMREGEGDDLPGVGRIGEDFLVAGHGGVEADFAHRFALGTDADALDHRAIGQHQKGRHTRSVPVAELGPSGFLRLRRLLCGHDRLSGICGWLREGTPDVKLAPR